MTDTQSAVRGPRRQRDDDTTVALPTAVRAEAGQYKPCTLSTLAMKLQLTFTNHCISSHSLIPSPVCASGNDTMLSVGLSDPVLLAAHEGLLLLMLLKDHPSQLLLGIVAEELYGVIYTRCNNPCGVGVTEICGDADILLQEGRTATERADSSLLSTRRPFIAYKNTSQIDERMNQAGRWKQSKAEVLGE